MIHEIRDSRFGLMGHLAIDRAVDGRACGGIRWGPGVTQEELQALAYDMSLKFGFSNIRLGGAKSGIIAPFELDPSERKERLEAFGRALAPFLRSGAYIPGADLGTSHEDALTVCEAAGFKRPDTHHGEMAGYYTGYGVVQAVLMSLRHLGLKESDCSVVIEGFGKVGGAIGRLLADLGIRVAAISTKQGGRYHPRGLDIRQLILNQQSHPGTWIEQYRDGDPIHSSDLYELPVDILIPCAGPWMIHESNWKKIRAKAIVPGANIPARRNIQEQLENRGVLYLPDFLCNSGGVLANTLEWRGFSGREIACFLQEIFSAKIQKTLNEAKRKEKSVSISAEEAALRNLEKMEKAVQKSKAERWPGKLVKAVRHPRRAARYLASAYYRRVLPLRRLAAQKAWEEAVTAFRN